MKRPGRRANKTGRSSADGKHVRLYRWLLRSAAWRHLSLPGRCLLVELMEIYNGDNNGQLFMSCREAARRLCCGVNQARRAMTELECKGFIRPAQRGSFSLKSRHATTWVLTEYELNGQPATKDFMRREPAPMPLSAPVYGGRNWRPKNKTRYPGKIPTVSGEDTVTPAGPPKTHLTVSGEDTVMADSTPATVSGEDTQIVYQGGLPEIAGAAVTGEGKPARRRSVAAGERLPLPLGKRGP